MGQRACCVANGIGAESGGFWGNCDIDGFLGEGQGDFQLIFTVPGQFFGEFSEFFAADSAVRIDQFLPREAADGGRHNAGCFFEVLDSEGVVLGLLESDPEQQLAGSFEGPGIGDLVQFSGGLCGHTQIEIAVGGEQSSDSFRSHLNSHHSYSIKVKQANGLSVIAMIQESCNCCARRISFFVICCKLFIYIELRRYSAWEMGRGFLPKVQSVGEIASLNPAESANWRFVLCRSYNVGACGRLECAVGLWTLEALVLLWSVGVGVKLGGGIGRIHVFGGCFYGFHLVVGVGFCVVSTGSLVRGSAVEGRGVRVGVESAIAGDTNRGGFRTVA